MSTEKNYLTRPGYEAMRAELAALIKVERPSVVQIVSWAASNGDRSENGDYIYGKKRLREIDRRMRFLTKRLEVAHVVDAADQVGQEQVFFGATVQYIDQSGQTVRIKIVGVDEVDPLNGSVSWVSPVARALLKSREGDTVTFESPTGLQTLGIVEVSYGDSELASKNG